MAIKLGKMNSGGKFDKWATDIQHVKHSVWISMSEIKSKGSSRLSGL